jgi:tripartite-type tricarboxylate transporter receptor subunit TctC
VLVDNRAGAGGNIGAEVASRAQPDGYTMFLAHNNHGVNPSLYRKLSYNILTDFTPVSLLAFSVYVASVHPSVPVKSVGELIAMAKARPGALTYASAGVGSGTFFSAEYFKALTNIDMLHVPYKGGGPALVAVLAGETAVYFAPVSTGLPHFRAGRLRPLGVSAKKPLKVLPGVPPISATVPNYELVGWAGLMFPAKTPMTIVNSMHDAVIGVLNDPKVSKRLEDLGYVEAGGSAADMDAFIRSEIDKYAKLIAKIGLPRH